MDALDLFQLWEKRGSSVFFNAKGAPFERESVEKLLLLSALENHLFIATSGSTGSPKWVALSKKAMLSSAEGVNRHLDAKKSDRWIHALPTFHVGGLSIYARAFLSKSAVVECRFQGEGKWSPHTFQELCKAERGTLTALVPTQLYDLVSNGLTAPPTLRASLIGGAKLDGWLYLEAKRLGWNPLPSYGMTECSSQVATAPLSSLSDCRYPELLLLPHIEGVEVNSEGRLRIKSPSLLTCYLTLSGGSLTISDPKVDGWFETEDLAEIDGSAIHPKGRGSDVVKINGEIVNAALLNETFRAIAASLRLCGEQLLIALPDRRRGHSIFLAEAGSSGEALKRAVELYNQRVIPLAKVAEIYTIDAFPKNALDKIDAKKLCEILCSDHP